MELITYPWGRRYLWKNTWGGGGDNLKHMEYSQTGGGGGDNLNTILYYIGEVAQWLAPRTSSANREVGSSNLTVSTDDPLVNCTILYYIVLY